MEKINVYLFRGEGCPYCHQALNYFHELGKEYGEYYQLIPFEVWDHEDNEKILDDVASFLKKDADTVPYIVIGNHVFGVVDDETKQNIKNTIKELYDKQDLTDVVKEFIHEKES